jgi:hypothetical protein
MIASAMQQAWCKCAENEHRSPMFNERTYLFSVELLGLW